MKLKEVVTYVLIIALLCLFKKNMYEGNSNIILPRNKLMGSVNKKKKKILDIFYR